MRTLLVLLVVICCGCASRGNYGDCPALKKMSREAKLSEFKYSDGKRAATGRHLDHGWRVSDHLQPWENVNPVGEWTYWYPNGSVKARINYELSCYIQCCSGGPCPQVHAYPVGPFEMWHSNGRPKARGTFIAIREDVQTSCEGGDTTTRGKLPPDTLAWDEIGAPVAPSESLLREVRPQEGLAAN